MEILIIAIPATICIIALLVLGWIKSGEESKKQTYQMLFMEELKASHPKEWAEAEKKYNSLSWWQRNMS